VNETHTGTHRGGDNDEEEVEGGQVLRAIADSEQPQPE
jgi:hypothetical protein